MTLLKKDRVQIAAMTACLALFPACGRKHKMARVPPSPQPARTASRTANGSSKQSAPVRIGHTETGTASWYGIPYHGRPAADGEIYDMETLVAAHRLLPFNTWLRVTNLQNSKTVDVRVIDRGPFVDGRIIDLSKAAARQIDLLGPGVGPVRLEVIAASADIPLNDFYTVQAGAFAVYANAERARTEYARRFGSAQLTIKQGVVPLYRVLVGKERSIAGAQGVADQLRAEGKNGFVVRLDETVPSLPAPASPSQTLPSR
ncbi:MAG: septal ring lytic transglycosylase RlpA family protein [Bryobacteraceae bacterium]|jgi:rare lipoprotein A